MAYTKYSLTPADNNAAPPNGAPEGMLPSAVNDTMRDMMAQIRDVGDGIRGGTYTMTAPVITGGSITGSTINNSAIGGSTAAAGNFTTLGASSTATLNTLVSSGATITGGSVNNVPIGASTANTGAFTTLSASSTATLNTLVSSGATLTGGSINGMAIGATTASTGAFSTLSASGVATFSAGTVSLPSITTTGDTNTGIFFPAADTIAFTGGGAESMRIDSSGNVGIGTSNASGARLTVRGAGTTSATASFEAATSGGNTRFYVLDDGTTRFFGSSNSETMRIDSSGNLLVGTSAQLGGERGNFTQTSTGAVLRVINSNASFADTALAIGATGRTSSSAFNFINCGATNADQFRVRGDGVIFAQNTTVQSISDVRTKENIADAENGLAVINALRPVRFDFKDGFGNNKKNQLGFIAQEMEVVFPDAVDTWCESDDPEQPYKSVGTTALIPVLVKAIQELKAELDGVKAELQTLKGN